MKKFILYLLLLSASSAHAQQFLNGSLEPAGTLTACTEVPSASFATGMGSAWVNSGINMAYVGDNTCGVAATGTHFIGLDYTPTAGGTNLVMKLSSPMIAGNTYYFSFKYKKMVTSDAATIFFGYNNPADSLGHDSTITFHMPPVSPTSWTTVTDSIKPLVNTQFMFFRAGTLGSSSGLITYLDGFNMQCKAPPTASLTVTGTHTINCTYGGIPVETDSVHWKFGDGGTSTTYNPTHVYTAAGTYTVCVIAYNGCGSDTSCTTVTYTPTVSAISSVGDATIDIHPNPATSALFVEHASAGSAFALVDMLGRTMYSGIISNEQEKINIADLPHGIYTIRISNKDGNKYVSRVMKE